MAIIPTTDKVYMVSDNTNTIYGGSAALQAMSQWYTMQDIIDSVPTGASGFNITLPQVTDPNLFYTNNINGATFTNFVQIPNYMYATPFIPANDLTVSKLSIQVATLAIGSFSRILVYADVNGRPSGVLIESVFLDCSTLGTKTYNVAYTFEAGTTYWLVVQSSSNQTLRAIPSTGLMPLGVTSAGGSPSSTLSGGSYVFGDEPPVTPILSLTAASAMPIISMQ